MGTYARRRKLDQRSGADSRRVGRCRSGSWQCRRRRTGAQPSSADGVADRAERNVLRTELTGTQMNTDYVVDLHKLTAKDVAHVGGKNASLGEMIRSLSQRNRGSRPAR